MNRRGFLGAMLAAPAIVHAKNLMPGRGRIILPASKQLFGSNTVVIAESNREAFLSADFASFSILAYDALGNRISVPKLSRVMIYGPEPGSAVIKTFDGKDWV